MTTDLCKGGVDLDLLQVEVTKLLGLLQDRQTGLMIWHIFLNETMTNIRELCGWAPKPGNATFVQGAGGWIREGAKMTEGK